MPKICFYLSAHGFGHATREIEVINHLPSHVDVEIVTTVPQWLFENSIHRPFTYQALEHDSGVQQVDSLHQDIESTYQNWRELLSNYPRMAQLEARRLQGQGSADLIVGDISPFTVLVGRELGVPSLIIANFSWDWIFRGFVNTHPEFESIVHQFQTLYEQCDCLLRTPLHGDLSVFPHIEDIPLIVRRAKRNRESVRQNLGISMEQKVVLISFGGHGFDRLRPEWLEYYPDLLFLAFDRRFDRLNNVHGLDSKSCYHPDILNACDLVVAKLGYGIVTECIAHQVPIAYPPRSGFPEYQVLEQGINRYVPTISLSDEAFFGGEWDAIANFLANSSQFKKNHLNEAQQFSRPAAIDGGEAAAQKLLQMINRV